VEEISKRICEILSQAMEEKKLKQADVCRKAGISQAYLSLLLKYKKKNASCRVIYSLLKAMDIDPVDFVKMLEDEETWNMNINP